MEETENRLSYKREVAQALFLTAATIVLLVALSSLFYPASSVGWSLVVAIYTVLPLLIAEGLVLLVTLKFKPRYLWRLIMSLVLYAVVSLLVVIATLWPSGGEGAFFVIIIPYTNAVLFILYSIAHFYTHRKQKRYSAKVVGISSLLIALITIPIFVSASDTYHDYREQRIFPIDEISSPAPGATFEEMESICTSQDSRWIRNRCYVNLLDRPFFYDDITMDNLDDIEALCREKYTTTLYEKFQKKNIGYNIYPTDDGCEYIRFRWQESLYQKHAEEVKDVIQSTQDFSLAIEHCGLIPESSRSSDTCYNTLLRIPSSLSRKDWLNDPQSGDRIKLKNVSMSDIEDLCDELTSYCPWTNFTDKEFVYREWRKFLGILDKENLGRYFESDFGPWQINADNPRTTGGASGQWFVLKLGNGKINEGTTVLLRSCPDFLYKEDWNCEIVQTIGHEDFVDGMYATPITGSAFSLTISNPSALTDDYVVLAGSVHGTSPIVAEYIDSGSGDVVKDVVLDL